MDLTSARFGARRADQIFTWCVCVFVCHGPQVLQKVGPVDAAWKCWAESQGISLSKSVSSGRKVFLQLSQQPHGFSNHSMAKKFEKT